MNIDRRLTLITTAMRSKYSDNVLAEFQLPCLEADLVQVKDELCQILNGVDVVVGGRGDERYARLAPPEVGDVGADLLAWQLATLTWEQKTL